MNIARLLKPLLCVAVMLGTIACYADSFLNTLAWTRYTAATHLVDTALDGAMSVDELGNTYFVYDVPDTIPGVYDVHFIRYDTSGNAAAVTMPLNISGTPRINSLQTTKIINGKRYVYALFTVSDSSFLSSIESVQLDDSGHFLWSRTLSPPVSNLSLVGLAGVTDTSGNFDTAIEVSPGGENTGTSPALRTVVYDLNGLVKHDFSDTSINPNFAQFSAGKWCATGSKNGATSFLPRWVVFDPVTGAESGQGNYPDVTTTDTYSYTISATSDSAGRVYLAITVVERHVKQLIRTNHFVRCYTSTGILIWTSKSQNGPCDNIVASTFGAPVWVTSTANHVVEQYDTNGNLLTNITPFNPLFQSGMQLPDPTGDYLLFTDPNMIKTLEVQRIGPAGTVLWSGSTTTAQGTGSQYLNALTVNGNLYTLEVLPAGTQFAVQRYVLGTTISGMIGGTLGSNKSLPVRVNLNSTAPPGGLTVKMTSGNPKLLFPNNSTSYSLAVPAGSVYANVTVHSATVSSTTLVTITGNQNGVVRAAPVTISP
jgi:hypothetical protein